MDLKNFWAATDATFPGSCCFFSSFSLSWTKGRFPVLGSQCSELNMPADGFAESHFSGGSVR